MSDDTCVRRMVPDCGDSEQKGTAEGFCPDWDVCLPFGGRLYSRDGCVQYEGSGTAPADGVYDRLTVQGGCITGVSGQEVASYQPRPCTETPCDCGSSGTGNRDSKVRASSGVDLADDPDSLLYEDASGALGAKIYVQGGDGASVSGAGTASDPLVVDVSAQESHTYVQGGGALSVTGSGTRADPYDVRHRAGGAGELTVSGMHFDSMGHLVSYQTPGTQGVVGVVGGSGIDVETNGQTGIATVSLRPVAQAAAGTHRIGGSEVAVDPAGRVTSVTRAVDVAPGLRFMGSQLVSVSAEGTLDEIEDTARTRTLVYHRASKRFASGDVGLEFQTALVGSLRVSLLSSSVTSAAVSVDGRSVQTDVFSGRADALTESRLDLGEHSVAVTGTFSFPCMLDVEIVTGY